VVEPKLNIEFSRFQILLKESYENHYSG